MTDITYPAEKYAAIENVPESHVLQQAAGHDGYVVDGADLSTTDPDLNDAAMNGFSIAGTGDGLNLKVAPGEAYVGGWLGRDTQSTVALPASTTSTVYVGIEANAVLPDGVSPADNENIIVGLDGDFSPDDPRLAIIEATTTVESIDSATFIAPMSRADANGPWAAADELPTKDIEGPFTIRGAFRDHLTLIRDGVGTWDVTPTTRGSGGLLFSLNNDEQTFMMATSGNIVNEDGDFMARSDSSMKLVASSSEPADYDVWFELE